MKGRQTYRDRKNWLEARRALNSAEVRQTAPIVLTVKKGKQTKTSRGMRVHNAVKGMLEVVLDWKGKS